MDLVRCFIASVIALFLIPNAYAGSNPIGWSLSGSVPATSTLNSSYSVNFTLTNNLPFTMPTPLEIANNSTPASEVTMIDSCSGLKLAPHQSCNVGLVLIPAAAGTKQLSIFMEYGSNKVMIPKPGITTQTPSASNSQLQGTVALGFPKSILSNTAYSLSFNFTNNGSTTLSGLTLSQQSGNSAGYTQSTTTCGATLAAGSSCAVTGSFNTSATSGNVKVGYTLVSGSLSASPVTSSLISSSGAGVRTFTFTNNCAQTVWFGFVGGAVSSAACRTNTDCASGSSCDPAANSGAGECFYNNPVPANGAYQLTTGASNTVSIADYGLQYVWSGNIAARTGSTCATGTCDTGDCASGGGNNACPIGTGFTQPATLAEFTLLRSAIDSYDISILNGTNVGIQITPTTNFSFNTGAGSFSPAEYNCGSPGNPATVGTAPNQLGGCNWATGFVPPAYPNTNSASTYVYVKPPSSSPTPCTSDAACVVAPNTKCGLSFNKSTGVLSEVCGQLLGYNSANQVCSFANTNQNVPTTPNNPGDAYFPCDSAISGGTGHLSGFTNWAMYACKAQANGDLGTCYNSSSTADCCGCVDWQNVSGITVPANTLTCNNFNSAWTNLITPFNGIVLPGIEWLKKACPTAYSYPFDDKSSSFGCNDISGSHTTNTVNYTITFCPS